MSKRMLSLLFAVFTVAACGGSSEPELKLMDDSATELPAFVADSDGLPVNDLAHVADVADFQTFASRDDDNNWCVILAIEPTSDGSDWATGASCAPSDVFDKDGVLVNTTAPSGRHGSALLLPDNFNGDISDDWKQINDNLAVRN